jgi:hypothetical protein
MVLSRERANCLRSRTALQSAYASDVTLHAAQARVRLFAVAGDGVFAENLRRQLLSRANAKL